MFRLFLLFTVVPVVELVLLIRVGGALGAVPTIGLCILTGFVGAGLARSQGASVVRRMQEVAQRGGMPARELLDGVLILVAGVVLLTPGFATDAIGLALLFPPTRALVRAGLIRRFRARVEAGTWTVRRGGAGGPFGGPAPGSGGRPPWEKPGRGLGPDQELVPPGHAPRPPRPRRPRVIDVDDEGD